MTQQIPLPLAQAQAIATPFRVGFIFFSNLSDPQAMEAAVNQLDQETRQQVQAQGRKFTKDEAVYLPFAIVPPVAWRYECGTCRYWQPVGQDGRTFPTCAIAGLPADRNGGEAVHPLAWCALWLPARQEPPFRWTVESLDPSLSPARGYL